MDHEEIISTLPGETHAKKAAVVGHGCEGWQIRDWLRRKRIPQEWHEAVALAHPNASLAEIAKAVSVVPSNDEGAAA